MASQDALPWPSPEWPPPAGPSHPGRKRATWIIAVAAVVVIGLAVGLVVWAP